MTGWQNQYHMFFVVLFLNKLAVVYNVKKRLRTTFWQGGKGKRKSGAMRALSLKARPRSSIRNTCNNPMQSSHLISKAGQKCNPYSDLCNYLKFVIIFPHSRREVEIWSIFNSIIFPIRVIRICMYINYSSFCPTSIVQFIPVSGSCCMCLRGGGAGGRRAWEWGYVWKYLLVSTTWKKK